MDGEVLHYDDDVPTAEDVPSTTPTTSGPAVVGSSSTTTTTPWGSAYEQWRDVKLKEQLTTKWDEAFGLVVEYKESTASEKHRLVTTVKEFAAGYKAEPSAERVEQLLRFFKRLISGLFERAELSEKHFIAMYQSISMVPDPAPLLFAAHVEVSSLVERVRDLQHECAVKAQEVATIHRQQAAAMRDLAGATNGHDGSPTASSSLSAVVGEVKELRAMLEDLRVEKRTLVEIVRESEAQVIAAKEESFLVNNQRRQLSQQLQQTQARYEDYVARSERDTNVLTAELAEAHDQLIMHGTKPSSTTGASSSLLAALETEVESLRQACAEAETRHVRELAVLAASTSARPKSEDSLSPDDPLSPTTGGALQHLVSRLQEDLSSLTKVNAEITGSLAVEKRRRREAEQTAEELTRSAAELKMSIKGLQRTIDELRHRRVQPSINPTSQDTQSTIAPPQKSNDEILAEMLAGVALDSTTKKGSSPAANGLTANDLNDPQLINALVAQRDALRARVITVEQLLSTAERDVERLRHLLEESGQAGTGRQGQSFLPVFDQKYRTSLMAAMPTQASESVSVSMEGVGDGIAAPADGRRRRKIQQTVRRAADGVAVLVANLVVHSPTTRLFLVGYLIALHAIVMITTYVMAFRGSRGASSSAALCRMPS
ncbi:Hypothetical protein, putative [Bodo saltans]|uniref:Cux N-terminal domain-containing protein n=1 Tax=Bodo saltans TaxID=75058 RepID=A0A0S4KIA7_BODSA|nr:Hypothetical protein, putative [Bodo saltans]|eukprot:CUI15410.1 Hypothetical protein, putative [Bodo saltans]